MKTLWILVVVFHTEVNIPQLEYKFDFQTHEQCAQSLKTIKAAFEKELLQNPSIASLINMKAECVEYKIEDGGSYGK